MSYVFAIVAGAVVAAFAVLGITRISMGITDRKSTDELKRARPDASGIHGDGHSNS